MSEWPPGIVPFGTMLPTQQEPRNPLAEAWAEFKRRGGAQGLLPEAPRNRLANALVTFGELSPGAGVRDMVQSSGDLSRATMRLDPLAMLAAAGGIGMGAIGAIPGAGVVDDAAKGATKTARAFVPDSYGYVKAAVPGAVPDAMAFRGVVTDPFRGVTEKFENALSADVGKWLSKALGMRSQGGSKWSNYAVDTKTGTSLRVSNHAAQNLGSLGVGNGKEMSVVLSPAAGELTLSSPAIRQVTGRPEILIEMSSEEFGKLASPEGRNWLLRVLQTGAE